MGNVTSLVHPALFKIVFIVKRNKSIIWEEVGDEWVQELERMSQHRLHCPWCSRSVQPCTSLRSLLDLACHLPSLLLTLHSAILLAHSSLFSSSKLTVSESASYSDTTTQPSSEQLATLMSFCLWAKASLQPFRLSLAFSRAVLTEPSARSLAARDSCRSASPIWLAMLSLKKACSSCAFFWKR